MQSTLPQGVFCCLLVTFVGFAFGSRVRITHCRLNEVPHTIYLKILIWILVMSGYVIYIFLKKNG